MKMTTALEIINREDKGFMVHFDEVKGAMLHSGYFPEKHEGEKLIETADEAWELAKSFAKKTKGKFVNIYVIGSDFRPLPDHSKNTILNR